MLFNNIVKEILADTYLSARIEFAEIEKLLLGMHDSDVINDIHNVDYVPVIYLAFINEDIAEFFLFSTADSIEEYNSRVMEKIDLIDIPNNRIKKVMLTEYAITIVLYLELDLKIPLEYKNILLNVLKTIIETNLIFEELDGITIELNKAYNILKDKINND